MLLFIIITLTGVGILIMGFLGIKLPFTSKNPTIKTPNKAVKAGKAIIAPGAKIIKTGT